MEDGISILERAIENVGKNRESGFSQCRERLETLAAISMIEVLLAEAKYEGNVEAILDLRQELRSLEAEL